VLLSIISGDSGKMKNIGRLLLPILLGFYFVSSAIAAPKLGIAPPLIDEVTDQVQWRSWNPVSFKKVGRGI